jgi:hypothetical protein
MMARLNYASSGVPQYGDYTPNADVNAGDVIVQNDALLICTGGIKTNGAGTGISSGRLGTVAVRGGFFDVAADGPIPPRSRVYWNAATSQITLNRAGNLQFGFTGNTASVNAGDVITAEFSPNRDDSSVASGTVAATGSTQADAALLADGFNMVTAADGTKGVLLPLASPGRTVQVKNNSASALKVWANTGDAINALAVNAAMSIPANTCPVFTAYDATTWYSNPLLPS